MIADNMSATAVDDSAIPSLAHGFRLQWEPAQNAHVLLYPEGMVKLNSSACEILRRCDGERTVAQIIVDLETTYATRGLNNDVTAFVALALEQHWLKIHA